MVGLAQWALVSGGAGKVAILSYTMPFWVVIFAAVFLGERLRRGQYFAILIAAFGLFLVLQPWQLDFSSMKSAMLAILSGVSWGASAIVAGGQSSLCPSSARGFIVVNILADALCGAGDECRELYWCRNVKLTGSPLCSGLWPTVRFWRRRWRGAYGCLC